jgi:acyl carrier protein
LQGTQKLQSCFRQGLALPGAYDVTSAESNSVPQWDSVGHLQLVVAIEDAFGVRMSPADVVDLKSYAAAVAILRRHGVWADA